MCEEHKQAVLAGDDKKVHWILKENLKIAEAKSDMMKKLVVNSEWFNSGTNFEF